MFLRQGFTVFALPRLFVHALRHGIRRAGGHKKSWLGHNEMRLSAMFQYCRRKILISHYQKISAGAMRKGVHIGYKTVFISKLSSFMAGSQAKKDIHKEKSRKIAS
ncbi:hypothetical protein [Mailhella massiliensis]|uniref:hypothetical protein n=1 Tax=Mailhella massiliensis TaxID=1903261 RepID=UPI00138FD355|nr:hypothetical protein [Mailhella massiliensis]